MCIEYDRTPTEPADTYLSLCLRPWNASLFVKVGAGVGVGVGVGVGIGVGVGSRSNIDPTNSNTLAPPCAAGRTPLLYFPLT